MGISTPTNVFPDEFPILSGSASTSTTTANIPTGALVFANVIASGTADTIKSFTDGTNSYNFVQTTDASNAAISLTYNSNAAAVSSGATFTCTTSDGTQWGIGEAFYVTGATGGLDQSNSTNIDTTATSISLSTGPLNASSEIAIGVFNTGGAAVTWTEDSAFSTLHNDGFNITSYRIVSSSAAVTWNPTFTSTGPFNAVLATFEATPNVSAALSPQFTASLGIVQKVMGIAL